jgi:1-acyl-sn-glycerol-3-phosphate acyltransferase
MKFLARVIFWITGWKIAANNAYKVKKMVTIAAPHTSNWDLLYARAAFYLMGIPVNYTVKKELFFFPLGWLLKALGGIPIDRKAPEGTRSYSPEWKKGFYYIAQKANVPIALGYLDYAKKEAGVGPLVTPTGDYEKDLETIQAFYRNVTPKYPEQGVR